MLVILIQFKLFFYYSWFIRNVLFFLLPHFTSALSRALGGIWFPLTCSLSISLSMISSSISLSMISSSVSFSIIFSSVSLGMYSSSSLSLSFCSSSSLCAGIGNVALLYFSCYKSSCIKYKKMRYIRFIDTETTGDEQ